MFGRVSALALVAGMAFGAPAMAAPSTAKIEAAAKAKATMLFEQAKAKPTMAGWFVGQVMKATGGKANPQVVNELVKKALAG